MEDLLQQISAELLTQAHVAQGESLAVRVVPQEENQFFNHIAAMVFRDKGIQVFEGKDSTVSAHVLLTVPATTLNVEYGNFMHNGLFGTKRVTRSVSAVVAATVENTATHEVLFSSDLKKVSVDTVDVNDIEHLENPSLKWTRGDVPQENFIDRAIEPFVIIGATGIAIYLFFHIRS